ncbi:hypothetical protein [Cyanobium sp. CH-040]|uniref:hypothetical protein n=1 Tax=Cyanobium sp. CH-040 TaxID=2823708 RepID=UPI0020CE8298|nr:hypothetical protein [Cyanobium sp. CH-040]MCP9928101.1 hypothetical protein [Cyanobium sp. CH-040]
MVFTAVYLLCFVLLLVGAFSLMAQGFRSAAGPRRHPEAPEPGELVMVVDLSRERLEQLYQQSS